MNELEITDTGLIMRIRGWDRLWAFERELRAPLHGIVEARGATVEAHRLWHGFRAPGTHLTGVIIAGTFYDRNGRTFWNVRDPARAIEIRLREHRFARFVIDVRDPDATIATLREAVARR